MGSGGDEVGVPADGGGVGDKNSGAAGVEPQQLGCSHHLHALCVMSSALPRVTRQVMSVVLRKHTRATRGCGQRTLFIARVRFGADTGNPEQLHGVSPRAWRGYSYRNMAALLSLLLSEVAYNGTHSSVSARGIVFTRTLI